MGESDPEARSAEGSDDTQTPRKWLGERASCMHLRHESRDLQKKSGEESDAFPARSLWSSWTSKRPNPEAWIPTPLFRKVGDCRGIVEQPAGWLVNQRLPFHSNHHVTCEKRLYSLDNNFANERDFGQRLLFLRSPTSVIGAGAGADIDREKKRSLKSTCRGRRNGLNKMGDRSRERLSSRKHNNQKFGKVGWALQNIKKRISHKRNWVRWMDSFKIFQQRNEGPERNVTPRLASSVAKPVNILRLSTQMIMTFTGKQHAYGSNAQTNACSIVHTVRPGTE